MELRLFDRTVALAICRYHMHTQFLRIYHIYSGRDEPCLVTLKLTNSLIASISSAILFYATTMQQLSPFATAW